MELISKEYHYHITEKDLIEWIKKEHQVRVIRMIQVDGMWGDSDIKEIEEKDRYILVMVEGEKISPKKHALPSQGRGESSGERGQARAGSGGESTEL